MNQFDTLGSGQPNKFGFKRVDMLHLVLLGCSLPSTALLYSICRLCSLFLGDKSPTVVTIAVNGEMTGWGP